ncbi:hypothetical protein KOW79_003400 [Hemibagrus wyckioides]|uniref:FAM192A/Fyv6 N-terminal domain-containing protein n=1 Tax=Hemibagrus wyckioides TaxID=337641 RepID=A0A9D3P237_9TELE|nr:hypothetical protein KOW79_003400 [Hemibagrus wyckioides]
MIVPDLESPVDPLFHLIQLITVSTAMADGVDLSRKFVSESELDEKRKKRQEEWEKVRKPDDPEEVPEEEYDPRSLFERLQEQKDKKQEEYEEQFKFKNMVKGLDEDEAHFLDEVSRQQCLVEKQRRDEDKQELQEYRISFHFVAQSSDALKKLVSSESQKKEPEKKAAPKPPEQKTSHLSQAHLLAGAVKRRSSSQSSESSKKQKVETTTTAAPETTGNGSQTEQETVGQKPVPSAGVTRGGMLHRPSAAMCVGILPGLGAYSGSSDSESSSDSEGSVEGTTSSIKCHRLFR